MTSKNKQLEQDVEDQDQDENQDVGSENEENASNADDDDDEPTGSGNNKKKSRSKHSHSRRFGKMVKVNECKKSVKMKFLRRLFTGIFLQLAVALSITYISMQSKMFYTSLMTYKILDVILLFVIVITLLLYKLGDYERFGIVIRLIAILFNVISVTVLLCLMTALADESRVFIISSILTSFFIFLLALYTLQPWFGFSILITSILVIIAGIVSWFVWVYQPNPHLFSQISMQLLSPPQEIRDIEVPIIMSTLMNVLILYLTSGALVKFYPDQWFQAIFEIFFDFNYSILPALLYIGYFCIYSRRSRIPGSGSGIQAGDLVDVVAEFTL